MKIAYYLPSLQAPGGIERIVTFKANYFAEHFDIAQNIIVEKLTGRGCKFLAEPNGTKTYVTAALQCPEIQTMTAQAGAITPVSYTHLCHRKHEQRKNRKRICGALQKPSQSLSLNDLKNKQQ